MKTKDWKAIAEKLKEIVNYLLYKTENRYESTLEYQQLESELSLLESQEVEEKKFYDKAQDKWRTEAEIFFMNKFEVEEIPKHRIILDAFEIIEAMEEYAQQSSKVTNEDIEKMFPTDLKVICEKHNIPIRFDAEQGEYIDSVRSCNLDRQFGAKALRDGVIKKSN